MVAEKVEAFEQIVTTITTDELLDLINDLADTGRCHYDHHGYCQEHAWFHAGRECPHARAAKIWDMDGDLRVAVTAPNTRQRAERAARRIYNEIDGVPDVPELTDIIAAEFEK